MNKIEPCVIIWSWGNVVRLLVGGFAVLALLALSVFVATAQQPTRTYPRPTVVTTSQPATTVVSTTQSVSTTTLPAPTGCQCTAQLDQILAEIRKISVTTTCPPYTTTTMSGSTTTWPTTLQSTTTTSNVTTTTLKVNLEVFSVIPNTLELDSQPKHIELVGAGFLNDPSFGLKCYVGGVQSFVVNLRSSTSGSFDIPGEFMDFLGWWGGVPPGQLVAYVFSNIGDSEYFFLNLTWGAASRVSRQSAATGINTYRLYWKNGMMQTATGTDIANALNRAGLRGRQIDNLARWERVK